MLNLLTGAISYNFSFMLGRRITAAVSWPTESRTGFANVDSIGHAFVA